MKTKGVRTYMSNLRESQGNRPKLVDINFTPYFSFLEILFVHIGPESMAVIKTK